MADVTLSSIIAPTLTFTNDVTGSGNSSIALTIAAGAVSLTKMANMATASFLGRNTAGSGSPEVLSVSTAKTMLSLNNVENTALSTWAGSSNLITLGTVTTGTWSATTISVDKGGTGRITSTTAYGLIAAGTTATGALQTLPAGATTEILVGGGASALPVWTTATGTGAPVRAGSPTFTGTPVFPSNVVTLANLAQISTANFLGRVTAATGNVESLTGTQATTLLDTFTSSLKGLAPASGGGTTNFLRADGTWASPPGGSGGITWSTISSANVATASTNTGYIMNTGGTLRTVTLPASAAAGFNVTVKAVAGQVRIVSNGNVVTGIGSGNDIILNAGMAAYLVGASTGVLEIIYAGATDTSGAVSGGYSVLSKTADYTGVATSGMVVILCDASSGAIIITLPTAVSNTAEYVVKKIDSSTNTVTIATTSSQTIDGGTTAVIRKQYDALDLISDNANWNII